MLLYIAEKKWNVIAFADMVINRSIRLVSPVYSSLSCDQCEDPYSIFCLQATLTYHGRKGQGPISDSGALQPQGSSVSFNGVTAFPVLTCLFVRCESNMLQHLSACWTTTCCVHQHNSAVNVTKYR